MMSVSPAAESIDSENVCVNVYVANLPQSADARAIRALFSQAGKVLHVKLLLDIATGTSRGIAFVMFDNMTSARKACALLNRMLYDGNVLQVRLAERSSQHQSPDSHTRTTVVYVRNVPANVTSEQMRAYCASRFGPVLEVTPHPQSAELGGPSPFNMLFVSFENVDNACIATEELDGKSPFPIPPGHPFTMAKMISDVAGEMRKSILLRRRSSDGSTGSPQQNVSPQTASIQPMGGAVGPVGIVSFQTMQPLTLDAVVALQQGGAQAAPAQVNVARRLSQSSSDSAHGVTPAPQFYVQQSPTHQRRGSGASSSGASIDGRTPLELAAQLPPTAFIPMVYSNPSELPPQMMPSIAMAPGAPLQQVVFLQQPMMFQAAPGVFAPQQDVQTAYFLPHPLQNAHQ